MLVQTESLCNQNNLLNDELDRLRQLLETAEDSFAASTKETVELREKIKKLQNIVDKKDALQRENEDLKSIVHYWMEKFERERDSNENQQESILLENSKLKKNLEQNLTDYQNSLSKIQELKMHNSKLLKKKKIEIEKLSDNFEIEIIKLKTELNKAGENMTLLKKTNKELQTTNFDLVAQMIQLKEDKSKFPEGVACPILPVVIEEDMDFHQQKNITDKALSDVSFNQSNNTLSTELKGMVGEFLPSPICEREHLSDSPDSNPEESRDSMLANLTNFKDILQSTVETVIEIKKQLVNFADKMELKTKKDVNCVSCSEFRLSLMATLSQYKDWVELLVCKKATLNSWLSQMIKILTDSSVYSFEDPYDSNTNTPEHDVELAKLKDIFKIIAMQVLV
ncbi:putative leucine-rich repeat-containing protein DDB_G0290503 isoform X1 [Octopus bimaculoides]|nr:putative leucine-rich repeat-containing protein DDB_G0290503 isoform X1 [Octopus bimaculoides]